MKRIFVTGGIGSGKTTAAIQIARKLSLPYICLDDLYFDIESKEYRKKRTDAERDRKLEEILKTDHWGIEGWHFGDWLAEVYRRSDVCLIIDVPVFVRRWRITKRFLRRKTGLEKDLFHRSGLAHLVRLTKWTALFNLDRTQEEIVKYGSHSNKIQILKNGCSEFIASLKKEKTVQTHRSAGGC